MHTPVLLEEVLACLDPKPGDVITDGTLGGCGHAKAILDKIGSTGTLIGLDQDAEAVQRARSELGTRPNVRIVKANFRHVREVLSQQGIEQVNGVLFDLGISSDQLETAERGFSFMKDGPLDMRMDQELPRSAFDLVNALPPKELAEIFWKYGEERKSRQIAERIVERRQQRPFRTTLDLAEFIAARGGRRGGKIHPATRIFQALRIGVNEELESLEEGLKGALNSLRPAGRLVVISFHSLEDRKVKQTFREWAGSGLVRVLTKKVIRPGARETAVNPRSRSAKLRAAEKG